MIWNIINQYSDFEFYVDQEHVLFTRFGIGIFDEEWLDFRLKVFSFITLPSILKQSYIKVNWFIFVDRDAPQIFLSELKKTIGNYSFIRLVLVDFHFQYFDCVEKVCESAIKKFGKVCVSKIDDDDAIVNTTFEKLYQLNNTLESNTVVTYPYGYEFLLQEREIVKVSRPFLTHNTHYFIFDINCLKILRVGHHKVEQYCLDNKISVIDNAKDYNVFYLYTRHKQSDSNFRGVRKSLAENDSLMKLTKNVINSFSINEQLYRSFRKIYPNYRTLGKNKAWDLNKESDRLAKELHEELFALKCSIKENSKEVL